MELSRLDSALFAALEEDWNGQCRAFDEDFAEYAAERIAHARSLAGETAGPNYGIYALRHGDDFEALMHINRAALPGTSGHTLRVVWILLAPKYDFGELTPTDLAKITMGIIFNAIDLSESAMKSEHIKIHLGNMADRQYFSGIALGLEKLPTLSDVRVRGNWFHISKRHTES